MSSTPNFMVECQQSTLRKYLNKRDEQYNIFLKYKLQYEKCEQEYKKYLEFVEKYKLKLIENIILNKILICENLFYQFIELLNTYQTQIDNYLNEIIEEKQNILVHMKKTKCANNSNNKR